MSGRSAPAVSSGAGRPPTSGAAGLERLLRGSDQGRLLRRGGLVWVEAEPTRGRQDPPVLGQLGRRVRGRGREGHAHADQAFEVHLLDGSTVEVPASRLREASGLSRPGDSSSDAGIRFDIFWGPETTEEVLAEELVANLFEKGFCVLRLPQSAAALDDAMRDASALQRARGFSRLPEEFEEHYLAANFPAKTCLLEMEESRLRPESILLEQDELFSTLVLLISPHMPDIFGAAPEERTHGLVALSLGEGEEEEFLSPDANQQVLTEFYAVWRRQLLKLLYFFGPVAAGFSLVRRESRYFTRPLPGIPEYVESVDLLIEPGSVLLFDPRLFGLELATGAAGAADADEPLLLVTAIAMRPAMRLVLSDVTGDLSMLMEATGPPPPPGDGLVNVSALATRMAASLDEADSTYAALVGCTDCVTRIPYSRFDIDIYLAMDQDNMQGWQTYAQHMSVVEGAHLFAAKAFEISNVEAKGMDPRQRHVMEVGAQALAGIGITKQSANRQVRNAGVSVGTDGHEWPSYPKEDLGGLGNSSNALGITANRFSFVYNLRGPSFIVDTACSASLYAAHYIKLSLLQRDWDPLEFCLAIGTQLFISVGGFVGCAQAHMLSQAGRCFTFNATADGYQRGDGTSGFVMQYGAVKKEAYGLFRGSNANQDGRSASLTAPNGPAQEACIWGAIREAKMQPPESTVWECHGTGTSLGDPIEVGAVRKVQIKQKREEPLMIGSIKSNMGHLEGGAAMSAMIKCIMQVYHTRCTATNHFSILNPHLEHSRFDAIFETESACFAYSRGHSQVSSFGFGGSNGHGIFWGECDDGPQDPISRMERKMFRHQLPEIRPVGANPDEWDTDWPDDLGSPDFEMEACFADGNVNAPPLLRAVPSEASEPDLDQDIEQACFMIVGNFNDWQGEVMDPGVAPCLHEAVVRVPVEGALEFHFRMEGDEARILAPRSARCDRMTDVILGPAAGLKNFWRVRAPVAAEVVVKLLATRTQRNVLWMVLS